MKFTRHEEMILAGNWFLISTIECVPNFEFIAFEQAPKWGIERSETGTVWGEKERDGPQTALGLLEPVHRLCM